MTLNLSDIESYDASEFPGRISGTTRMGSALLHVEAIQTTLRDGIVAVNTTLQDRIDAVGDIDDYGDGYQSVMHQGRPYFVIIYPYQT
jgi:hypothetical protein